MTSASVGSGKGGRGDFIFSVGVSMQAAFRAAQTSSIRFRLHVGLTPLQGLLVGQIPAPRAHHIVDIDGTVGEAEAGPAHSQQVFRLRA